MIRRILATFLQAKAYERHLEGGKQYLEVSSKDSLRLSGRFSRCAASHTSASPPVRRCGRRTSTPTAAAFAPTNSRRPPPLLI